MKASQDDDLKTLCLDKNNKKEKMPKLDTTFENTV